MTNLPTLIEQTDAFTAYSLLGSKKYMQKTLQDAIARREEELQQAGNNAGEVMQYSYVGYRMALEDLYFNLYGEELPEVQFESTIDWDNLDV